MNPTVSIIVPIYNAEKYLNRCVDSILNQEYTDFELILVNDGSKDASPQICDEYAKEDARVRVIHKENTGVSDTRNIAIGHAAGKYLQFLDSDDWITPDACWSAPPKTTIATWSSLIFTASSANIWHTRAISRRTA